MCHVEKYSHGKVKWKQAIFSIDNFTMNMELEKRKRASGRNIAKITQKKEKKKTQKSSLNVLTMIYRMREESNGSTTVQQKHKKQRSKKIKYIHIERTPKKFELHQRHTIDAVTRQPVKHIALKCHKRI